MAAVLGVVTGRTAGVVGAMAGVLAATTVGAMAGVFTTVGAERAAGISAGAVLLGITTGMPRDCVFGTVCWTGLDSAALDSTVLVFGISGVLVSAVFAGGVSGFLASVVLVSGALVSVFGPSAVLGAASFSACAAFL